MSGAEKVEYSDGYYSNLTDLSKLALDQKDLIKLYTTNHSPFVFFQSVQEGKNPQHSLKNLVAFEGPHGLYADLSSGKVPTFSFIVPNRCNDQHGLPNAGDSCKDNSLATRGDMTLEKIVNAIHQSPVWKKGRNAILVTWDEGDGHSHNNQVMLIADTNYGPKGVKSSQLYSHYSLLKSIESGLGLPCLNHACDADVNVMADLLAEEKRK